jgi:hypothetical protein
LAKDTLDEANSLVNCREGWVENKKTNYYNAYADCKNGLKTGTKPDKLSKGNNTIAVSYILRIFFIYIALANPV